jgi:hypothetical protein
VGAGATLNREGGIPSQRDQDDTKVSVSAPKSTNGPISVIEAVIPRTFTDRMEQLQEGYVTAVAATAGCSIQIIDRDIWGCDAWIIRPPQ